MENKCVDIIIPVFNELDVTRGCFESIVQSSDTSYRLIIIDNASVPETRDYLKDFSIKHENVELVRNEENLGWVRAVNQGIKVSTSPYVCIMNNDTIVRTKGWLSVLIRVADMSDDIGLVNPVFQSKVAIANDKPYIEIDFCRGYCVLIKRAVIDKIGALDEAYGLGYYDDDDFSVRAIRAGFRCVRANNVTVEHLRDTTFCSLFKDDVRRALHQKNKELFYSKWGRRLNIFLIYTGAYPKEKFIEILFFMARRQHIIYLLNSNSPLNLEHINIREKRVNKIFVFLVAKLLIFLNSRKKEFKRYNLIFTDDRALLSKLASRKIKVHYIETEKYFDDIKLIVDKKAY